MERTRNQPILLIAAGQGAMKTVAEVPRAARGLCVRVAGPFGLLVAGGPAGRIRASSCFWLSDVRVPEIGNETAVVASGFEQTLFEDLCSLVRRLRAGGEGPGDGSAATAHIHAYAVIDLATPDIVPFTIQLLTLLRRAGPSIEMTGLTLTGRTAETGTSPEPIWCEPFGALVTELENVHLLQRLYVLDGEDTNGTWLRDLGQMYRIGAEFILHHGMSPYRHSLRRREKTRMSLKEPFLDFCGSAMCKRFRWDSAVVAREVAATLAGDVTIQDVDPGALSEQRSEVLEGLAQRLVEDIASAYDSRKSASDEATPGDASSAPVAGPAPHEKAGAAVEQTLKEVCSTQPVLSLHWFLKALRPRLNGLATFGRLRARREARFRAARVLRQQAEDTYTPMGQWQKLPGVEWRTPTEPFIMQAPSVVLSSPVSRDYASLAIGLAVLGLGMIALGAWRQREAAMLAGGVLAIWASLLTVLPVRWVECHRTLIPPGVTPPQRPPVCEYQKRMPEVRAVFSSILLVLGAGCLAWAVLAGATGAITGQVVFYGSLFGFGGLAAAVLIYLSTTMVPRPQRLPAKREVPGLSPPWDRPRYMAGLASLTMVWALVCLGSHLIEGPPNLVGLLVGLGAVLVGLVLTQLPRSGSAELTCPVPKMPQRPADSEGQAKGPDLAAQVASLQSWVDRLLTAPETSLSGDLDWGETNLHDLLPKMFTSQWRRQLAEAFKKNQEIRSGTSLRQMVDDPQAWTRCLMEGLSAPGFDLANPLEAFWGYYVKRWLEDEPLEHVISQLELDPEGVMSTIVASVPPRWPQTRANCDVDTSTIAVRKELWDIMGRFSDPDDPHRFAVIDWQDRHTVAVIRIVQGLSQGWRGLPVLPASTGPR